MSIARLQERVPSAKRLEMVTLKKHQLRFHMSSDDGSGKCDCFLTNNNEDIVLGALFDIGLNEKDILDKAESLGYGYEEKMVEVESQSGEIFEASLYYAIKIEASLKPYSWYLNHVVIGAKETKLPNNYLAVIQSTECIEDLDKERDKEQRAIHE
jgi:hypothetical protein